VVSAATNKKQTPRRQIEIRLIKMEIQRYCYTKVVEIVEREVDAALLICFTSLRFVLRVTREASIFIVMQIERRTSSNCLILI
jgi:hypothetical protein